MAQPSIVRALNANGDWEFGGGKSNYLQGNAAIGQQIKCRLQEFTSNCFWNPQGGLNWPALFGQKNQQVVNLSISSVILNTDGVTGLIKLNVNLNRHTRQLSVSYTVTTVYSVYSASFSANVAMTPGG
jgi:hypothetical protein